MESEFLLNVSDISWECTGNADENRMRRNMEAASRLQEKCQARRPFVSVVVKNPRCWRNKKEAA